MTDNIEREKFDVYWGERRWPLERITNPSGYVEYKNAAVQNIWMGWQARAAASPDESRDIEMIEYAIDNRVLSAEQILAAFNESRKR